jgi:hypothetical protein
MEETIKMHLSLEEFVSLLQIQYRTRYTSLMSEQSLAFLVKIIRSRSYKIEHLQMFDLLCKQLHEVNGYVKRDDIFTLHTYNNEISNHFVISMRIEDRLVVDALTALLYSHNKKSFCDNHIYLTGFSSDLSNEMNSWEDVYSFAVFNIKPILLQLDRNIILEHLKKHINADPVVWQLFEHYFALFPRHKANMYQYESYQDDLVNEGEVPFKGLPLIGSLPIVLLTLYSGLDPCVKKFIGDWPYVRINYDFIFPIFGDSAADEEPYMSLYDFFIGVGMQVNWCWVYKDSGVTAISSGYINLDNGKVLFQD